VALAEDETTVIASGTSVKRVYDQAIKQGVSVPILFKVPPSSPLTLFAGVI